MQCGLLGRKLGHSYSPQIHSHLGNYPYTLYEKEPEDLEHFLKTGDFSGLNVTIPYKKEVIPYLDDLSPLARELGAVNTIVRREDGTLFGHNTDYFGFRSMVEHSGLSVAGKKCLVLGSGGASRPVVAVLKAMGGKVTVITHKENTPENLKQHPDTAILVNTTPVGMYPNNGTSPVDLDVFPHLEGVLDLIFNPSRTELMLQAEARGLLAVGGLWMLVAQAKEASEWFTGTPIPDRRIGEIHQMLGKHIENIILIGMPGCGKSTVGRLLAEKTGRTFVDADAEIIRLAGKSIPVIFAEDGEAVFRDWETKALASLGKQSGLIIATGGGCITREQNLPLLRQNGKLFWLQRDIAMLPTQGRPLSQAGSLEEMYARRKDLYARFSDYIVPNDHTPEDTAQAILNQWEGSL